MQPTIILIIGYVLLGVSVLGGGISAIILRMKKSNLNKQYDIEYGERR